LENIAYPKSGSFFEDIEMLYKEERIVKDQATISTSVIHKKEGNISIDFKLYLVKGRWLLWDVILDGISLVTNLKTQFNQIITESSYQELIRRMNERLKNG
jgi:phospholipid transport system substrate-binding protein